MNNPRGDLDEPVTISSVIYSVKSGTRRPGFPWFLTTVSAILGAPEHSGGWQIPQMRCVTLLVPELLPRRCGLSPSALLHDPGLHFADVTTKVFRDATQGSAALEHVLESGVFHFGPRLAGVDARTLLK
jgi:hypothetical protein